MSGLTDLEKRRYHRHLILSEIGEEGQLKLKAAKVLVVGSGGLGSPVLFYLTAAGIGTIGIIDNDTVDLSNLQRQILHATDDLGKPKTESAFNKLSRLSPDTTIVTMQERLTQDNVRDIIDGYQAVVDATDNFPTRFVLNEACAEKGIPFLHGGISGFFGQAMTIVPGQGPCFQCLFRTPPPPEAVSNPPGVVGAVAGTIGTIQAAEAVKIILGSGRLLTGRLLMYDAMDMQFREVAINKNPGCSVCSNKT